MFGTYNQMVTKSFQMTMQFRGQGLVSSFKAIFVVPSQRYPVGLSLYILGQSDACTVHGVVMPAVFIFLAYTIANFKF